MTAEKFSLRAQRLKSSAIRDLLKITERPGVISFAGGLPSASTFPIDPLREACERVLSEDGQAALQYAPTEGYMPLREWVAARHSTGGLEVTAAQVLITTGSQQALDLLGKVLIDPGSRVLVETPTYLGALQAFSLFEPVFDSIASDDDGLIPEAIAPGSLRDARFLYCLPNFQNPSGRQLKLTRRRSLAALAARHGLYLVEDDPYGSLSYSGESLPSLLSMHSEATAYMGSFSKILAPGLRVGYVIAPQALHHKLTQAKQAADLHTPSFNQRIVYDVVKDGFLDTHIPKIRNLYAGRCSAMLNAMEKHFPPGVGWTRPSGGMFIWVTLPAEMDSAELLRAAMAENVVFVPGESFFAGSPQKNTLRLSFVTVAPEKISQGIAVLGALIAARLGLRREVPA
jgi:2-aminoadipate transaminase